MTKIRAFKAFITLSAWWSSVQTTHNDSPFSLERMYILALAVLVSSDVTRYLGALFCMENMQPISDSEGRDGQ